MPSVPRSIVVVTDAFNNRRILRVERIDLVAHLKFHRGHTSANKYRMANNRNNRDKVRGTVRDFNLPTRDTQLQARQVGCVG